MGKLFYRTINGERVDFDRDVEVVTKFDPEAFGRYCEELEKHKAPRSADYSGTVQFGNNEPINIVRNPGL